MGFLSARLVSESFKPVNMTSLRAALGVTSHADAMKNLSTVMLRFWEWCPHVVCGFKVFDRHVITPASVSQLIDGGPTQLKLIILERRNISAEYASWRRAVRTGNWGRTPREQLFAKSSSGTIPRPGLASNVSFQQFKKEHIAWFREVNRSAVNAPVLRLQTEEMIRSPPTLNWTRSRVFDFLGLEPYSRSSEARVPQSL